MWTEVRISFDGNDIPGGAQAVLGPAGCGPDVATVEDVPVLRQVVVWVILDELDPRLQLLLQLLQPHIAKPFIIRWDRYTDEELDRAPLIVAWPHINDTVFGGPRVGHALAMS